MVKPWKKLKRYGQAGEPAGSPVFLKYHIRLKLPVTGYGGFMNITQVHF